MTGHTAFSNETTKTPFIFTSKNINPNITSHQSKLMHFHCHLNHCFDVVLVSKLGDVMKHLENQKNKKNKQKQSFFFLFCVFFFF